jgi:hypothetical protein
MVIAVIGLGVALAALSTTLNINGTAKIQKATWSIHYDLSQGCYPSGQAKDVGGGGTVSTTNSPNDTWNIAAEFEAPGDELQCEIELYNDGTIDAKLSGFTKQLSELNGKNISAKLLDYYPEDGKDDVEPQDGDIFKAKTYRYWTLILTYTGPLVKTDSPVYHFSFKLPYVQAN